MGFNKKSSFLPGYLENYSPSRVLMWPCINTKCHSANDYNHKQLGKNYK